MLLYCFVVEKGIISFTGTQARYIILVQNKINR